MRSPPGRRPSWAHRDDEADDDDHRGDDNDDDDNNDGKDNNDNHVPTGEFTDGGFVVGKEYRTDKGVWLTPNPNEGEEWKNKRYKEFFEKMGVSFSKNESASRTTLSISRNSSDFNTPWGTGPNSNRIPDFA